MSLTVPEFTAAPEGPGSSAETQDARDAAMRTLVDLVAKWREAGRKTLAAGLKPGLQQAIPGFSETELGYPTFRAFVMAAEERGLVKSHLRSDGHTLVLLPHELLVEEAPRPAAARPGTGAAAKGTEKPAGRGAAPPRPPSRLRPEVWGTFIDWHEQHRRLWDRQTSRCFAYPTGADGRPAWEGEPDRFVEVDPVGQNTQIGWMREWAEARPEPSRSQLLAALADNAPRGQFRRDLVRLAAVADWRAELQRRVLAHATAWAHSNSVSFDKLLDHRQPEPRPVAATPAAAPAATAAPCAAAPGGAAGTDGERLRALVHRAVDRMTLAELMSLPLRAEHLLDT